MKFIPNGVREPYRLEYSIRANARKRIAASSRMEFRNIYGQSSFEATTHLDTREGKTYRLRPGCIAGLIHDLYSADKDNQTFLHTRFGLGKDVLQPYKKTIKQWLAPDVLSDQKISVSKAKHAIACYKKAIGDPQRLAELMVFFCDQAANFSSAYGYADEPYFDALVRMFEEALELIITLPAHVRNGFVTTLEQIAEVSHNFGYGVGDDMDFLLGKYRNPK